MVRLRLSPRHVRALMASAALAWLVVFGGPRAGAREGGEPQAVDHGLTYRLEATWEDEPWELVAGRYGHAVDVSSAPDGTVFVLDTRHGAVHVLGPDGTPKSVFLVPDLSDELFVARRLDAGPDGTVHVMSDASWSSNGHFSTRVDHLTGSGRHIERMELETLRPSEYRDVAVGSDGGVYLSRMQHGSLVVFCDRPAIPEGNSVDVYRPYGVLAERIESRDIVLPDSLDVAADGTVYVVNKLPGVFCPPPGPPPTPPPSLAEPNAPHRAAQEPAPTPPLSLAEPNAPPRAAQEPTPAPTEAPGAGLVEGVLVFGPGPGRDPQGTVAFTGADDVAVGVEGAFVARNVEIFALGEPDPLYQGPSGDVYIGAAGSAVLRLDVPLDGRLLASMAHCYFQGLLIVPDPTDRPAAAKLVGDLDLPDLAGPPYPLRIAASDQIAVLQGRFGETHTGEPQRYTTNATALPQTVQRWSRLGQVSSGSPLVSQLGACSGADDWWVRDVALDGDVVYTADSDIVRQRPDNDLPAWSSWPAGEVAADGGSRLAALSARDGRVAVLDGGAGSVYVLDERGSVTGHWPIATADESATPADIALGVERIYLADRGRGRIDVRGIDGRRVAEWRTHDGPERIAADWSGNVYLLGAGGWGFRYAADGTLEAAWPMPDPDATALDIAVDVDGRVYVGFAVFEPFSGVPAPVRGQPLKRIGRSGIWVFAPARSEPSPPPEAGACVALPDKRAWPPRLPLGATVDVALDVEGRCPGEHDRLQLALVFDTSRSMNYSGALGRAKDATLALLGALDPDSAEVALIRFDDGAVLKMPLSRDTGAVAAEIASLEAWGDTRLAAALETSTAELTGPRGDASLRRIILVVTDGVLKDSPLDAALEARNEGIELRALVVPTLEFDPANLSMMNLMTGDPGLVLFDPDSAHLGGLARALVRFREQPGLFATITIRDIVPGNMQYVEGSAWPPASWDATSRTLTWRLGDTMAAEPIELSYRLRPLAVGTWPTNIAASAAYVDALGSDGRLVFPVPEVEVLDAPYRAFVPYAASGSCLRRTRPIDVVLAIDTSSSMEDADALGHPKIASAKAAAQGFLDHLAEADHAALVAFDESSRTEVKLTADHTTVAAALEGLRTARGTRLDLGLREAREALADGGRPEAAAVVVLLTDGLSSGGPDPVRDEARALRDAGVTVFAVGLGVDVDSELLSEVATSTDNYFASPTAGDLAEIYSRIAARIACPLPWRRP